MELPKFVVLTGKNGSGKTQLFEGIHNKRFKLKDSEGEFITRITYIESGKLSVDDNSFSEPTETKALLAYYYNQIILNINGNRGGNFDSYDRDPNGRFLGVARQLAQELKRNKITEISYDEMVEKFDEYINSMKPKTIFSDQLSETFTNYFGQKWDNDNNQFLAEIKNRDVKFLTDEEFLDLQGPPPWELINEVLKNAKIPYTVTQPEDEKKPFKAQLKSVTDPQNIIEFSDLSSGERTLCKLAIAIYQTKTAPEFPDLLLLDEPDAHLHPCMSKQMIDTLVVSFLPYIKHGIIITTHSPSTCALAPDGSLFYMQTDTRRPMSIQIDDALEELCVGIPTLSIRKENERQIIVESNIDAELYTSIWQRVRKVLELQNVPNLNFISSGKAWRKGNCEQAQHMCASLRKGGSTTCFAIIDYDGKNKSNDHIFVLGEGERYSIENFILNPLSIAALLVHHHGSAAPYEFLKGISIIDIKDLPPEQYQIISDGICNRIETSLEEFRTSKSLENKFPGVELSDERIEVSTITGLELKLPVWYSVTNGHVLEKLILAVFPKLLHYGRDNEAGKLMTSVCTHILAPIPEFIPLSLSETLVKLTE